MKTLVRAERVAAAAGTDEVGIDGGLAYGNANTSWSPISTNKPEQGRLFWSETNAAPNRSYRAKKL